MLSRVTAVDAVHLLASGQHVFLAEAHPTARSQAACSLQTGYADLRSHDDDVGERNLSTWQYDLKEIHQPADLAASLHDQGLLGGVIALDPQRERLVYSDGFRVEGHGVHYAYDPVKGIVVKTTRRERRPCDWSPPCVPLVGAPIGLSRRVCYFRARSFTLTSGVFERSRADSVDSSLWRTSGIPAPTAATRLQRLRRRMAWPEKKRRPAMRLDGKTAIVTGGARGIGFAVARRYVQEGARVALWDVLEEQLDEAKRRLEAEGGVVMACTVNVTRADEVARAMDRVEAQLGPVDIMVNNAGITRDAMLHRMEEAQWDAVVDVNLKGVFLCGREAAIRMRERGRGVILNTSSVVGLYGNVGQTNYAATKAGVVAMTRTWARELGGKGVRVNAVAPGYILTEMVQAVPEKILDGIKEKAPLKRLGQPEDIAAAFAYLASDDAGFVTGHVLSVDGGLTL